MPTPFTSQDLNRIFDARALTRGRTLGLQGGVEVRLEGDTIRGTVQDHAVPYAVSITPSPLGRRVVFGSRCSCQANGCAHLAAASFAALERFPILRKAEQQSFLDRLTAAPPEKERQRIVFELAPADPPYACSVTTMLVGERSGIAVPTPPGQIALHENADTKARGIANLLGPGNEARTGVAAALVTDLLAALIECGQARWHAGGRRLIKGETRFFPSAAAVSTAPQSAVIVGDSGPWYIDAATGAVGPVRIRPAVPPQARPLAPPLRCGAASNPRRSASRSSSIAP